jgi:hypothetical protein
LWRKWWWWLWWWWRRRRANWKWELWITISVFKECKNPVSHQNA